MNEPLAAAAGPAKLDHRPSRWPSRLGLLLALVVVLMLAAGAAVSTMHFSAPVHITIDGEEIVNGFNFATLEPAHKMLIAALASLVLLAALVVVPLALVMGLVVLLGAIFMVVGLPLVLALMVVALLLSPLLLVVWLLWRLLAS